MRRSFIIALTVFLWLFVALYMLRLNHLEFQVRQIRSTYEKFVKRTASNVSASYFQWDTMYECVSENKSEELEKWLEDLKHSYPMVEKAEIVEVEKIDFELYKITSSSSKLVFHMAVCNDDASLCLTDRIVLLIVDAQKLLEELGISQIKIVDRGKDFVFGLKYARTIPVMDHPSWAVPITSSATVFLLSLLFESRRRLKALVKESNLRKVQQALLDITERYLQGTKIEQMYQFLLEKAIEAIPKAQGGSVLVKKNDRYVYTAAVGYELEGLSKITYTEEEVRTWTKNKPYSINRQKYIVSVDSRMDDERLKFIEKFGRIYDIKCNINFAIEAEGRLVVLFNIDNFEDEDAFDVET
ncbi:hypothetical protein, partial [Pseudothermotoga sp.]|nr:hypothetical protein [Pseudothermotoga sp.]MDW8138782.1 hypothetical protein [Pseudothermotoga sp.]